MAKYNYDKSALKGLGVGAFLGEVKVREKRLAEGKNEMPKSVFNPNIIAAKLHPSVQLGKIARVEELPDAKIFAIVPNEEKGCKQLAYFRAGQYVSIALDFDGASLCRPYTLCSAPRAALGSNSTYLITIKKAQNGYASEYILNNWQVGTEVVLSAPLGNFYYQHLRDAKNVVALAGGSGITPFLSMALAIADGTEDFNLTILYGSRDKDNILLKDILDACVERSEGKVKVVHILSEKKAKGYEFGYITTELIEKYAPAGEEYSIFVCGPKAMYKAMEKEIAPLNLPIRRVRYEVSGEYGDPTNDEGYPQESIQQTYTLKVWIRGECREVPCKAEESLLHAMETAGIRVPSDCRSGQCGWCHSRLISGQTYIPASHDGRRAADKKFGWIHPCATYALSNIELEVFPMLEGK